MSYNSMLECTSTITIKGLEFFFPSKEDFESLGFIFHGIGDNVRSQVTLPEGWTVRSSELGIPFFFDFIDFIDEKGRLRAFGYRGAFFGLLGCGSMQLYPRFTIAEKKKFFGPYTIYVKDFDGTCIFEAGKTFLEFLHYKKIYKKAEDYLNTNFPDWKDPTKYWD